MSSPVRAFKAVGGTPPFLVRGEGAYVWDADGNRYLDYVMSWGPLILGHAHPRVLARVRETLERGLTFGAPSPWRWPWRKRSSGPTPSWTWCAS